MLSVGVPRARLVGVDMRPEAVEQTRRRGFEARRADWLTDAGLDALGGRPVGAVITGPPFCIAPAFARVCLDRVAPGGFVAPLLQLTFLEPALIGSDTDRAATGGQSTLGHTNT